ncbi:MAG: flagellin [Alphaproteobacteria bacterium]|nr:flagellin [Alphaproteobacteria bacterium]
MAIGDITLTSAAQANLNALQSTAQLLSATQKHLSTGKTVNSASDNATKYFASQGFLNTANNLDTVKSNLGTSLEAVNSFTNSISSVTKVINQLQGLCTQALSTQDAATRTSLATQYGTLCDQLDALVEDASFNGTNLLNSAAASMRVYFNSDNTNYLDITGVDLTSATLIGSADATNTWVGDADIQADQANLLTALNTLTADAASFGGNATLIQTRQSFTGNMIESLKNASSSLISADTNEEGANLQALQAQNSLGIVSLGVSGQLAQAILKIL